MLSIRCLDEGIDIPACKEAYLLASTRNERQFVQRRGRVLRIAEDKDFAIIYDFIIIMPESFKSDNSDAYIKLLDGEFSRVTNFASISQNNLDSEIAINNHFQNEKDVMDLYQKKMEEADLKIEQETEKYNSYFE